MGQVSFTLDEELLQKIDNLAAKMLRSRSDAIKVILKIAVENIEFDASGGTGVLFKSKESK